MYCCEIFHQCYKSVKVPVKVGDFSAMEDIYFWSKNGRPLDEKDRPRNSRAEYCLSHMLTSGTIVKNIYGSFQEQNCFEDLLPNLHYTINKRKRWEAEDKHGIDIMEQLSYLNEGWKVFVVERVMLKTYTWPSGFFGYDNDRLTDFFPMKKVHSLKSGIEYCKKEVKSAHGNPGHVFTQYIGDVIGEPIVSYSFMRAPRNYLNLLKKRFQDSNFGYEYPRERYWKRIERKKERGLQLRYEVIEDLDSAQDGFSDDAENDEDNDVPPKYYNLMDHFTDKFVMVKRK